MEFFPYEPFDNNAAQIKVWNWLREAFKNEPGVAYYRYPIFSRQGTHFREPDVLMLHPKYGLWVFECKSYSINNIAAIQGHQWQMNNWYNEYETPVAQAEEQMYAIGEKLEKRRETRGKVRFHFRVALPNVRYTEWQQRGYDQLPSTMGVVLVYENLTPAALKTKISNETTQTNELVKDWECVKIVLGGTLPAVESRPISTGTPSNNPIRVIQYVESQLRALDENQQKIAFEIPNGPQRLRGLAGTGKTVLLCKKIAKMHIKYPDWTIGYVFFTRSLYDQIRGLITSYHQDMHPDNIEPNWTKLKVLHAWGGKQEGFYSDLARRCSLSSKTVGEAKNESNRSSPAELFEYICLSLVRDRMMQEIADSELRPEIIALQNNTILDNSTIFNNFFPESVRRNLFPVIYDAILIDEGQDLPPVFYQLAYQVLSSEKRLYWAYDEAQGIGSLIIPKPETVFGKDADNNLIVNLSGSYAGGIQKSHVMTKCYRTPRLLLMTAHAINMGLFRCDGPLQGFTTQEDWNNLGYDIVSGNFQVVGQPVTIKRKDEASPHAIDKTDFQLNDALGSTLLIETFKNDQEEQKWIAKQIANDIQLGFNPRDIFITALDGDYEKEYFINMKIELESQGVQGYIADTDLFRINGCVTISNIYRAKGNEAWKIYACRFNYATKPLSWKKQNELHKRNEAFVAITRSRVWCVVTGLDDPIFDELRTAISQYPNFTFPAFNKSSLKRVTES